MEHANDKTSTNTDGGRRAALRVLALLGALAVIGIGAVFFWLNVIRDDAPAQFELSETAAADPGNPVGTWTIGTGSQAGYRVVEDIAGGLQNFEAVGRTDMITGTVIIAKAASGLGTVTAADFEVDIASMTSASTNRDNQFKGRIMNAKDFPTSTFALTEPITLDVADSGVQSPHIAIGELTLRGVTLPVTVTLQAQMTDIGMEIVGSIPVVFTDYNIPDPSVERIVSVREEGLVEFSLQLTR